METWFSRTNVQPSREKIGNTTPQPQCSERKTCASFKNREMGAHRRVPLKFEIARFHLNFRVAKRDEVGTRLSGYMKPQPFEAACGVYCGLRRSPWCRRGVGAAHQLHLVMGQWLLLRWKRQGVQLQRWGRRARGKVSSLPDSTGFAKHRADSSFPCFLCSWY